MLQLKLLFNTILIFILKEIDKLIQAVNFNDKKDSNISMQIDSKDYVEV